MNSGELLFCAVVLAIASAVILQVVDWGAVERFLLFGVGCICGAMAAGAIRRSGGEEVER